MQRTKVMQVGDLEEGDVIYGKLGDEDKVRPPRTVSWVRPRTNLTAFRVFEGSDETQGGELWELPTHAVVHVRRPADSPCVRAAKAAVAAASR